MSRASLATKAYTTAASYRSKRDQEADVFRHAAAGLAGADGAGTLQQARALADNRRLWTTLSNLMRDPTNALPEDLRAAIVSVGVTVQREMHEPSPDFKFLIAVNESLAEGLAG